jgi:PAS domain S-box-containing protein
MAKEPADLEPDYRLIFERAPVSLLVITPDDFKIVAASDAYLQLAMVRREDIVGRPVFDVFEDNPAHPAVPGTTNLKAALERVVHERGVDTTTGIVRYDARRPAESGGDFEERYWSVMRSPLFDPEDNVAYIVLRVEDVTELVSLQRGGAPHELSAEARKRVELSEHAIYSLAIDLRAANSRLQEENTRFEALFRGAAALSEALAGLPTVSTRGALQTVIDRARAITGARYAALGVGTDPARPFDPFVVSGLSSEEAAPLGMVPPHPVGILGAVARGETIRVAQAKDHPAFVGFPPYHHDVSRFLGVPLRRGPRLLGAIFLGKKIDAPEFSLQDQMALEVLAARIGTVMEFVSRHEAEVKERKTVEALGMIADAARPHLGRPKMFAEILERTRSILGTDTATILVLAPDGRNLERQATLGPGGAVTRVPVGSGVAGQIAAAKGPIAFDDLSKTTSMSRPYHGPLASLAGVALRLDGRLLGVLLVGSVRPRHFTLEELNFLTLAAERIAPGIEMTRLYEAEQLAVTALEQVVREHNESLGLVDALLAGVPPGIALLDSSFRFLRVNEAFAAITGVPASAHLGKTVDEIVPSFAESLKSVFRRALDGRERVVQVLKDERRTPARQLSWRCHPVELATGEVVGVGATVIDVTDLSRTEARQQFLAEAGRVLASSLDTRTMLDNLVRVSVPMLGNWAAVFMRSESGAPVALAWAHVDPALRAAMDEFFREDNRPELVTGVWDAFRTKKPTLIERFTDERLMATLGESQRATVERIGLGSSMTTPIVVDAEAVGAIVFVSRAEARFDGEDLALAEAIAKRAALAFNNARLFEELKRANRARDDFLAIVSHDVRSPLSVMVLNAGLIARVTKEDETRNRADAISSSARDMETLLGDLLDVASLDAGHLRVERRVHDVGSVVADAVAALRPLAESRSIHLTSEVQDPDTRVSCDRARIVEIFSNLIGNALKFTPAGGAVRVAAELLGREVRFSVRDNGPGIAPEHVGRVFDRNWQAEATPRRGAGLGLYITKALVELHGGRVWVESELGSGSTFFFTLTAEPPMAREARAA